MSDFIVVDCSVAVKWVVDEPLHTVSRSLLLDPRRLIAPELLLAEVVNVAFRKCLLNEITAVQGAELVRLVNAAIGSWHSLQSIALRAFHLSQRLEHSAYDCCYLALAELVDGRLVTDDRKLISRAYARGFAANVLRLSDLSISGDR